MGIQNCHYNCFAPYFQLKNTTNIINLAAKNIINLAAILDWASILLFNIVINRFYTLWNILIDTKMMNIVATGSRVISLRFFSFWGVFSWGAFGRLGDPAWGIFVADTISNIKEDSNWHSKLSLQLVYTIFPTQNKIKYIYI